jgi:alanine dehydrogenase
MPTLLLRKNDVAGLLDMKDIIAVVEQTLKDQPLGKTQMPPKVYLVLDEGDFRAMPAATQKAAVVKWVNVHPKNHALGLPTVMAILIYSDPSTGYPLAIMDASDITAYRTGAMAAIASKYLARKDAHTLGIIGAGRQAHTQLLAHAELFRLTSIKVHDISESAVERLIGSFPGYPVKACPPEAAAASDIVCTVTTSQEPVIKREWIAPGTHINAIGADAPGKEELDPSILKDAVIVVDDLRQAAGSGEINVPLEKGLLALEEVYGDLGEIVAGKKQGREDEQAITVFDSTGMAIEDLAVARLVYGKAQEVGGYLSLDFV